MILSLWKRASAGGHAPAVLLVCAAVLAACVGGDMPGGGGSGPSASAAPVLDGKGEVVSPLIQALQARRSILPQGSAYAQLAEAVLQAERSPAEAELRVKRLTARARSKNWLPRLTPSVNLTSLSSIVASLIIDQPLFDNGRRRAERDFAAADVEVAAVSLASELNSRVHAGLKLYLDVLRARELAAISRAGLARMTEFERIVGIRLEGGLSDRSEYQIISQKRAEMEASLTRETQGEATALAELEALTHHPLGAVSGMAALPPDAGAPEPLSVLLARGEAARTIAEVKMTRAGLMPGVSASGAVGEQGEAGLRLDGDFLGFGRGDQLAALGEAEEVTRRKVEQARHEANRQIVALERQIASLSADEAQGARLVQEMEANLTLFTRQYEAGRRSLLELVNQFESLTVTKRRQANLKYQIAQARLQIAMLRGVLIDGVRM